MNDKQFVMDVQRGAICTIYMPDERGVDWKTMSPVCLATFLTLDIGDDYAYPIVVLPNGVIHYTAIEKFRFGDHMNSGAVTRDEMCNPLNYIL